MIIGDLYGGLGNQMFQYAFFRAISLERKIPIKFCTSNLKKYNSHNGLELNTIFDIELNIASSKDICATVGFFRSFLIVRKLLRYKLCSSFKHSPLIYEPYYHFWTKYYRFIRDDIFLSGYWQSQKYFEGYSDTIQQDFTFSLPLNSKNLEVANLIKESISVSIHVRRGDYLINKKTLHKHGVCSLDYYENAINLMLSDFPSAKIFAFSDDINWVRNFLMPKFKNIVIIDLNYGGESYNDMRLMSLCKHNIISNSTFSWWGAWLNKNTSKKVIAPKQWFADGTNCNDLIPEDWNRI
jgi:hypothetical protein